MQLAFFCLSFPFHKRCLILKVSKWWLILTVSLGQPNISLEKDLIKDFLDEVVHRLVYERHYINSDN